MKLGDTVAGDFGIILKSVLPYELCVSFYKYRWGSNPTMRRAKFGSEQGQIIDKVGQGLEGL